MVWGWVIVGASFSETFGRAPLFTPCSAFFTMMVGLAMGGESCDPAKTELGAERRDGLFKRFAAHILRAAVPISGPLCSQDLKMPRLRHG